MDGKACKAEDPELDLPPKCLKRAPPESEEKVCEGKQANRRNLSYHYAQVPKIPCNEIDGASKARADAAVFAAANQTQDLEAITPNHSDTKYSGKPVPSAYLNVRVFCADTEKMVWVKFDLGLDIEDNLKKNNAMKHFGIDVSKPWAFEDKDCCSIFDTDLLVPGETYILKETHSKASLPPSRGMDEYVKAEKALARVPKDVIAFEDFVGKLLAWIAKNGGTFVELRQDHDASKWEQSLASGLQMRRGQFEKGKLSLDRAAFLSELNIPGFTNTTKGKYAKSKLSTPKKSPQKSETPTKACGDVVKKEKANKKRKAAPTTVARAVKKEYRMKLTKEEKEFTSHENLPTEISPGQAIPQIKYKRMVYCTLEDDTIADVAKAFRLSDLKRIVDDNTYLFEGADLSQKDCLCRGARLVLYWSAK